jgi:alanine transaminase
VRGELVLRAAAIKQDGFKDVPFDKLLECNIGNPQAVGQQPLSFGRQVLSLMCCPQLLELPGTADLFAPDAIARAKEYLASIPNGIGAYSESQGFPIVREQVADFIAARDGGFRPNPKDIFLTDGASKGVGFLLSLVLRGRGDGVLVPIPQYPLYSASLALQESHMLGYELVEESSWALPVPELQKKLDQAKADGIETRALVVINPGNPTGNTLSEANMKEIVTFCAEHDLVLMADEVYQENVYEEALPFFSFKKVVMEANSPVQLVSFHSTSKGFLGECGLRGGYFELINFDPDVQAQLVKLVSIGLCSNTLGQIATGLMVAPPKEGDASYAAFRAEKDAIIESMKRRALRLVDGLNALEGVSCNAPQGAMYAFPQITLPPKAIAAAEAAGKVPDTFYALALLEATGIVVVPGSGFGQVEGTWHFRTTFLPPEDEMASVVQHMKEFHEGFMAKYR